MREKQQTNGDFETTDGRNIIPFETELNSFIEKAMENGCTMIPAVINLKKVGRKVLILTEVGLKKLRMRKSFVRK